MLNNKRNNLFYTGNEVETELTPLNVTTSSGGREKILFSSAVSIVIEGS